MKIPKNLHFIRGARKLASLKQFTLLFLIKLDFLYAIFIRPILIKDEGLEISDEIKLTIDN